MVVFLCIEIKKHLLGELALSGREHRRLVNSPDRRVANWVARLLEPRDIATIERSRLVAAVDVALRVEDVGLASSTAIDAETPVSTRERLGSAKVDRHLEMRGHRLPLTTRSLGQAGVLRHPVEDDMNLAFAFNHISDFTSPNVADIVGTELLADFHLPTNELVEDVSVDRAMTCNKS